MILDRNVPIARIVPVESLGRLDDDARLADLERRGILRRPSRRPDPNLMQRLGPPPRADGDILAALLAERDEGR